MRRTAYVNRMDMDNTSQTRSHSEVFQPLCYLPIYPIRPGVLPPSPAQGHLFLILAVCKDKEDDEVERSNTLAQDRVKRFTNEVNNRLQKCNHGTNATLERLSQNIDPLTADIRKFEAAQVYALL
jgi:hypothetical protein